MPDMKEQKRNKLLKRMKSKGAGRMFDDLSLKALETIENLEQSARVYEAKYFFFRRYLKAFYPSILEELEPMIAEHHRDIEDAIDFIKKRSEVIKEGSRVLNTGKN